MAEQDALAAMRRIEDALDRIEAIAATPRAPSPLPEQLTALEERHEALRRGVRDIVTGLDRLIESETQRGGDA